jgi:NADPH:quinone reductase-like Zn-dependent oxidoreductase
MEILSLWGITYIDIVVILLIIGYYVILPGVRKKQGGQGYQGKCVFITGGSSGIGKVWDLWADMLGYCNFRLGFWV